MLRTIGLLGLVGLLAAAAPARVDDTYTIKIKKSGKGSVSQHQKESTDDSTVKVVGPDGKVLNEKRETKTTIEDYKETIVEKEKGKRATKIIREYKKAVLKTDGKEQTLPYNGKTLVIEKKDDKYHFTIEGGEELKGKDAESLDRAFNKTDDSDNDDFEKTILPKKPVAVNDTWKIEPEDLLKSMGKDVKQELPIDKKKITGQGKLLRAYKKDGRQYGVFDVEVNMPLKGDLPLGKTDKAPLREGSKMTLHAKVDACIDGTSSDSSSDVTMEIDIGATIKTPDGQELKLTVVGSQKGKDRETELPKK